MTSLCVHCGAPEIEHSFGQQYCPAVPGKHYGWGDNRFTPRSEEQVMTFPLTDGPDSAWPKPEPNMEGLKEPAKQPANTAVEKCAACRGDGLFDYDDGEGERQCLNCNGTGIFRSQQPAFLKIANAALADGKK